MKRIAVKTTMCCLLVALGVASPAVARETYRQFADRMNAVQLSDVKFRPDLEAFLLHAANAYRATRGAGLLSANKRQLAAARAHAMDMALNDFVGHTSSNGRDFDSRMRAFRPGEMFLPSMAENAARASGKTEANQSKAAGLMQQWINSPPHRKALASRSYVSVATAVVQKGVKLYAVEIFVGPEVKTSTTQGPPDSSLY